MYMCVYSDIKKYLRRRVDQKTEDSGDGSQHASCLLMMSGGKHNCLKFKVSQ